MSKPIRICCSHDLGINYQFNACAHIWVLFCSYFSSVVSFWCTNLFLRGYQVDQNRRVSCCIQKITDGFCYSFLLQCIAWRSSRWYPHNADFEDFRGQAERADKSWSWQRTRNRRRTNRDWDSGIYKTGTRTWWEVLLIMVSSLFIYLYIFLFIFIKFWRKS